MQSVEKTDKQFLLQNIIQNLANVNSFEYHIFPEIILPILNTITEI